ncbi:MAG: hypothetical protein JW787_05140 [Sedimentisphaerales bacterium]|nr:hypothetical protein [Sedimentisphaerales bacterium]
MVITKEISIKTKGNCELINMTGQVVDAISNTDIKGGDDNGHSQCRGVCRGHLARVLIKPRARCPRYFFC